MQQPPVSPRWVGVGIYQRFLPGKGFAKRFARREAIPRQSARVAAAPVVTEGGCQVGHRKVYLTL